MKRLLISSALTLALALPLAGGAAELDYTYLEGGWNQYDVDDGTDGDGWSVAGSLALGDHWHLFGSYSQAGLDHSPVDVDVMRLGAGWNTAVADDHDLVVRANLIELDTDFPGADSDGYEAEVGLRSAFGEHFETYAAAGYLDIDRGDGDLYGRLGAQYKFTDRFGLVANATFSDDAKEFFVGPRLSF